MPRPSLPSCIPIITILNQNLITSHGDCPNRFLIYLCPVFPIVCDVICGRLIHLLKYNQLCYSLAQKYGKALLMLTKLHSRPSTLYLPILRTFPFSSFIYPLHLPCYFSCHDQTNTSSHIWSM